MRVCYSNVWFDRLLLTLKATEYAKALLQQQTGRIMSVELLRVVLGASLL